MTYARLDGEDDPHLLVARRRVAHEGHVVPRAVRLGDAPQIVGGEDALALKHDGEYAIVACHVGRRLGRERETVVCQIQPDPLSRTADR